MERYFKEEFVSKVNFICNKSFGTSSRIFGEGATFVKPEVNPLGPGILIINIRLI
jgi:hypothetical protein